MSMERFGYGRGSLSETANVAISQWLEKEAYISLFLKQIIENARKYSNILAVIIFGSYARGGNNYNDIDVAILLNKDNVSSPEFLVQYTDVKGLFDVSILNRLSINIRKRVLSEGRIIYCSDKPGLYDYNFKLIEELAEFGPRLKRILEKAVE